MKEKDQALRYPSKVNKVTVLITFKIVFVLSKSNGNFWIRPIYMYIDTNQLKTEGL